MKYDHKAVEKKWQKIWEESRLYRSVEDKNKPKSYVLDMFPYPSGDGLHVGHPKGYIATDVYSRRKRMQGHEVLHPMGWDAFGLPAENYAIKNKVHPRIAVERNIARFKEQLGNIGFDYDWSREINTTDPAYYKWTQWIFLQMFKKGLAYESNEPINWCPSCQTGLANEDVEDGRCERCGTPVEKRPMRQWVLKITDYADRLLQDLDALPWPEHIKELQRNWIGRSEGAEIDFEIAGKYKFVLLHGYKGNPEDDFFPWLKNQLEARGHEVYMPLLPHSKEDTATEELDMAAVLEETKHFDERTIVVGHSLGAVLALKLLEKTPHKVHGLVLAGGFVTPDFLDHSREFTDNYKWEFDGQKIRSNTGWIKILHDEHDDVISSSQADGLGKTLSASVTRIRANAPHFNSPEEPVVLQAALPSITVFTTRPDTLFGATYMVIAPEHPLIHRLENRIENIKGVAAYVKAASQKTEIERTTEGKEKTGLELKGIKAINPATKEEIPVFVADYVLGGYGTGAIMAVPAHDERDFAFAEKFDLAVTSVIDHPKYAIFDFDGVLGDTFEATLHARVAMGDMEDIDKARDATLHYHRNKPVHDRNPDLSPEEKAKIRDWSARFGTALMQRGFELFEEFIDEVLKVPNLQMAVVSSGSEIYVKPSIENSRLNATHVYGYQTHASKQEKVRMVCRDWGIDIREIYYFTDSKADVYELEDLLDKKKIIGCSWGFLDANELQEVLPREQILENYADIHRVFGRLLYTGEGKLINSGTFTGLDNGEAKEKITEKFGRKKVSYKLRDWVFSRQRYWGEPIPLVHCEKDGWVAVPEKDLPVRLPEVDHYEPTGTGESPLANIKEWVNTTCPQCGGPAKRETNTMPQWAGSSWYYLRFMDPHNDAAAVAPDKEKYWAPVDMYVGGAEHATRHLIYARFWHKFLLDIGVVSTSEPFHNLHSVGLILAEDGRKMSKRFGNVINPDDVVNEYGADAFRVYEMFMGPFENAVAWSTSSIAGAQRFVERIWRFSDKIGAENPALDAVLHQTVKKVGEDIDAFKFNTAISSMMIFLNAAEEAGSMGAGQWRTFLQILAPFAPHITEELWEKAGGEGSVHTSAWPAYDSTKTAAQTVKIMLQINGKTRGSVELPTGVSKEEMEAAAHRELASRIGNSTISRVIVVPGRLVNLVLVDK